MNQVHIYHVPTGKEWWSKPKPCESSCWKNLLAQLKIVAKEANIGRVDNFEMELDDALEVGGKRRFALIPAAILKESVITVSTTDKEE